MVEPASKARRTAVTAMSVAGDAPDVVLRGKIHCRAVGRGQQLRLARPAALPDWAHGMVVISTTWALNVVRPQAESVVGRRPRLSAGWSGGAARRAWSHRCRSRLK
jgi:hypothetical protein